MCPISKKWKIYLLEKMERIIFKIDKPVIKKIITNVLFIPESLTIYLKNEYAHGEKHKT